MFKLAWLPFGLIGKSCLAIEQTSYSFDWFVHADWKGNCRLSDSVVKVH